MFFVTLLLAAVESWMRGQRGTSGLRALLAFDEIVGYLPPVANPPSRPVLLRLLKQGRAFGLGLVLATQNPTDLNYKALSNAGTWCIGRLQTERDKQRLLDGLQSLDTGLDRATFDKQITALKPRLFLLHNVHQPSPRIFQSRWDLNYLAGPLTRVQLEGLGKRSDQAIGDQGIRDQSIGNQSIREEKSAAPGLPNQRITPSTLSARPALPAGVSEYFFAPSVSLQRAFAVKGGALRGPLEPQGMVYKPALLAQAELRYYNRRYNLDYTRQVACLVPDPEAAIGQAVADWESFTCPPYDAAGTAPLNAAGIASGAWTPLDAAGAGAAGAEAAQGVHYLPLPGSLSTARSMSTLQKDFLDWAYRNGTVYLRANEALKVYAGPKTPEDEFHRRVQSATQEALQAEIDKAAAGYDQKLETLKQKIEKQQLVVDRRQDAVNQRKDEQNSTDFELLTSVFTRRKRSVGTSISKRRMTHQAQGELDKARHALEDLHADWKALAAERQAALQRVQAAWQERAAQVSQVPITPVKKDIFVTLFGVAWLPYHLVKNPDGMIELPAF
jgi:hypothetical protein